MSPPSESGHEARTLEIAHVLFMDLVKYSRLHTDVQTRVIEELRALVQATPDWKKANAASRLISLPTGDGMALVFFQDPLAPVQCALQLSEQLRQHPGIQLRMGIHSGPVYRTADVNTGENVAGAGINGAQRVMDLGDAGHILLTKTSADTLHQISDWGKYLTDLGEQRVKHNLPLHVFNLCTGEIGNPKTPSKLRRARQRVVQQRILAAGILLAVLAAAAFGFYRWTHRAAFDSLAVIPMVNTSGDPKIDYRSEAMTDSLIATLAKLPNLRVISRSAVMRYRNKTDLDPTAVGEALQVATILTGTVSQRENKLLVTVELVRAKNKGRLWGHKYERPASEFSAIQEDIAQDVTSALRINMSSDDKKALTRRYTNDPEAENLYQLGHFYWNQRTQKGLQSAIEYFTQATQKDPNYALAFTGLADAYSLRSSSVPPKEAFPQAKVAALQAVYLDDNLAEAHASLGFIKLNYDWDWPGTEKEYKRAIELNPKYATAHSMYANYLMVRERFDEAYAETLRAHELDVISLPISVGVAHPLFLMGKYDDAIAVYRAALKLNPNFLPANYGLGVVYEQQGLIQKALAEYSKGPLLPDDAGVLSIQGHAYALAGDKAKANLALQKLADMSRQRYVSPCEVAAVYAGLGEADQMFQNLDQCYNDKSWEIIFLKVDPTFKQFRSDERFTTLIKNLKLE